MISGTKSREIFYFHGEGVKEFLQHPHPNPLPSKGEGHCKLNTVTCKLVKGCRSEEQSVMRLAECKVNSTEYTAGEERSAVSFQQSAG
jgi:hypothetical protein